MLKGLPISFAQLCSRNCCINRRNPTVLEHTTTTAGQAPERLQLHSLLLPNGRLAHTLDRDALFREAKAMGVKNVVPQDGHQTLLVAIARHMFPAAATGENEAAKAGGITSSKTLGGLR
jgi:hypothetical protein